MVNGLEFQYGPKAVFILRGIPGCGKSTYAREKFAGALICSTDDFFMVDGEYKFDPTKLAEYHNANLRQFASYIMQCRPHIVVDNTNIAAWEIAPYYRLAEAFGYDVRIIQFLAAPGWISSERNSHNVPREVLQRMAQSMEPLPPWWKVQYVEFED